MTDHRNKVMHGDLSETVWFVTGASTGLGRAIVNEVLLRGGCAIATARSLSALQEFLVQAPDRVVTAELDVSRNDQIQAAVDRACQRFGRIDVLVNNAGYGFLSAAEEASDDEVRAVFEVNFFGLAAVTRAVLPAMRKQSSGKVVNISSIAGVKGYPGSAYYSASKFAVEGFSEALAAEAQPLGVGVLIVEPGPFRTDFAARSLVTPKHEIGQYSNAISMRHAIEASSGKQAGDPLRAAKIIVDTAMDENAPLRLVLGGASFDVVCNAIEEKLADIRQSNGVAAKADFPRDEAP